MSRLLLVRHGQTAWNAAGKLQGHTDIELDDTGREQARAIATTLATAKVSRVWTSDLARARQTGEIVATALGLDAPRVDPALRERAFGVFEGLTRDECAMQHPDAWAAWQAQTGTPPGGEPREAAVARLAEALERIAREAGTTLVVAHGGIMRLWLSQHVDPTVALIPNGTIFTLDHDGRLFSRRR